MLKSILTNSTFTTISRVLGFLRDVLIAHFLGAGIVSDCFFVAFKLPNFFRRLFAEGAFNAAFVPAYARIREQGGAEPFRIEDARSKWTTSLRGACFVFSGDGAFARSVVLRSSVFCVGTGQSVQTLK